MAWNKPNENKVEAEKKCGRRNVHLKGLLAGTIVVLGAGLAAWLLTNGEADSRPLQKKERGRIKEVAPAAVPKAKEPTNAERLRQRFPSVKIPDGWEKPYPPQAYRKDGSLKRYSRWVCPIITNDFANVARSLADATFKDPTDRDIANILSMTPGESVFGDMEFDQSFVESFLESLKHPVEYDHANDTPEQKDLKDLLVAARKELKAHYDAGEDIAKLMTETREQFRELSLYRDEIKNMVDNVMGDDDQELSDADKRDLIGAANKMLEERGCEMPLTMPETFIESVVESVETEN